MMSFVLVVYVLKGIITV